MSYDDTKIHFNIWDDFYDDGHVPEGKIQKTHGYVEESKMPEDEMNKVAKAVYDYIDANLDMTGVKVRLAGSDVLFEHLTHVRLDKLVKELQNSKLEIDGKSIAFYSES